MNIPLIIGAIALAGGLIWLLTKNKKAVVLASVGTATLLTALNPAPIPIDLQLKVPKEQVIEYRIDGEVAKYAYKSRLVKDKPNEIVSKRTFNTRYFTPQKPNQTIMEISVGQPYYKDEGKWYRIEVATTTKEYFNIQMGFNSIFGKLVFGADYSIIAGADDGSANPNHSGFSETETEKFFGAGPGGWTDDEVWFRFQSITANKDDNATAATIEFTTDGTDNGTDVQTAIYGVDEDDHAAPTTFAEWNTDHGIHTTAKVDWDFATLYGAGDKITTDDFADVIDELLARGSWSTGNDIGIHIDDDGGAQYSYRTIAMYENTTYTEPVLSLTIEAAPAGTNMQINIGDVWKDVEAMQINIGDSWKAVEGVQINIGDAWKVIY